MRIPGEDMKVGNYLYVLVPLTFERWRGTFSVCRPRCSLAASELAGRGCTLNLSTSCSHPRRRPTRNPFPAAYEEQTLLAEQTRIFTGSVAPWLLFERDVFHL